MTAAPRRRVEAEPAARASPSLREILPRWVPYRIVGPPPTAASSPSPPDQDPTLAEILPAWISARRVEPPVEPPPAEPPPAPSWPDLVAVPEVEQAIEVVVSPQPFEIDLEAAPLADATPPEPPVMELPPFADDLAPHPAASAHVSPLALADIEPPPAAEMEYSPLALAGIAAPNPSDLEHAPLTLAGLVPPTAADLDRGRFFKTAEPPFPGSFADLLRRIAEDESKAKPPASSS